MFRRRYHATIGRMLLLHLRWLLLIGRIAGVGLRSTHHRRRLVLVWTIGHRRSILLLLLLLLLIIHLLLLLLLLLMLLVSGVNIYRRTLVAVRRLLLLLLLLRMVWLNMSRWDWRTLLLLLRWHGLLRVSSRGLWHAHG